MPTLRLLGQLRYWSHHVHLDAAGQPPLPQKELAHVHQEGADGADRLRPVGHFRISLRHDRDGGQDHRGGQDGGELEVHMRIQVLINRLITGQFTGEGEIPGHVQGGRRLLAHRADTELCLRTSPQPGDLRQLLQHGLEHIHGLYSAPGGGEVTSGEGRDSSGCEAEEAKGRHGQVNFDLIIFLLLITSTTFVLDLGTVYFIYLYIY